MHSALRARHSLAMHFATFAGSDLEALEPIVELKQAKREIGGLGEGEDEGVQIVGDWWMEGWDGRYRCRRDRCRARWRSGSTWPRVLSEERHHAAIAVRTYKV